VRANKPRPLPPIFRILSLFRTADTKQGRGFSPPIDRIIIILAWVPPIIADVLIDQSISTPSFANSMEWNIEARSSASRHGERRAFALLLDRAFVYQRGRGRRRIAWSCLKANAPPTSLRAPLHLHYYGERLLPLTRFRSASV
jgi:signal transduction histidine kinase